jgi:hypothetical protein
MFDFDAADHSPVELARELAPAVDVMFDNAWKIRALVAELYQLTLQIVETGPPERPGCDCCVRYPARRRDVRRPPRDPPETKRSLRDEGETTWPRMTLCRFRAPGWRRRWSRRPGSAGGDDQGVRAAETQPPNSPKRCQRRPAAGRCAETFGAGGGAVTPSGIAASGGHGRAGQACSRDWCSAIARRRSFVSAQALLSGFGNGGRSWPRGQPRQRWRKRATHFGGCT